MHLTVKSPLYLKLRFILHSEAKIYRKKNLHHITSHFHW